jgi:hypothetical protein
VRRLDRDWGGHQTRQNGRYIDLIREDMRRKTCCRSHSVSGCCVVVEWWRSLLNRELKFRFFVKKGGFMVYARLPGVNAKIKLA